MKVKIVEGLKAKFPGVSNSIINRITEKILETVKTEEEAEEAVEAMTFQQAIDANGDSRATEAANTAYAKYEKKYGLKDGKPINVGDDTPSEPDKEKNIEIDKEKETKTPGKEEEQEPAWAKIQREKMEALEARLTAIDGDKLASTRKKQLVAAMGKAPEKLRARYEKDLTRMNFKDDSEYSEWLEEVKTDMEAFVAEAAVKGVTFGRPPSGGGPRGEDKPSPEVAARIKSREAETVAPAILGLPARK